MTEHPGRRIPSLYLTAPGPCPYLPGRRERKVFTHLLGADAEPLNDALSEAGFRRSQTIAYRPACEGCNACVSVRIRAEDFVPSKAFRRVINMNGDLSRNVTNGKATQEQFGLLRAYLDARHDEGGMAEMTALDYVSMVEDSTVRTDLVEYRLPGAKDQPGKLVAVALTDVLNDGLSMVYTFFDVSLPERSLGTHLILDHVDEAQRCGLPHVYLGYWIDGCRKMSYKARFKPLEALTADGWRPFEQAERQ